VLSERQCLIKFHHKLPGVTIPSKIGSHRYITKVRFTGSVLNKKPPKKCGALTVKKADEIVVILQYNKATVTEMFCTKSSATKS
jgi:hypothetical protein